MEIMSIYVVIVTYNGMQWYDCCFNSLRLSKTPLKVVVIDNASSDGTVDYIKTNYPEIQLVVSKLNLGFGQANNIGFRLAIENNADYVFLLNQDAWIVQPDTIEQLAIAHKSNAEYGIISPMHLYGSGEKVTKGMKMDLVSHNYDSSSDIISDLYFNRTLNNIYKVDYVCAAAWLIPCSVLKIVGGFDPIFFHYGEDDNYMQRIVYHGFFIGICPKVSICHDMEFRGGDYGKDNNNWEKNMLIECADVNKPLNINKLKLKYLFKSLKQIFFFQFYAAYQNLNVFRFIHKKSSAIKKSYSRNKKSGSFV